jgi:hypothetical protein
MGIGDRPPVDGPGVFGRIDFWLLKPVDFPFGVFPVIKPVRGFSDCWDG